MKIKFLLLGLLVFSLNGWNPGHEKRSSQDFALAYLKNFDAIMNKAESTGEIILHPNIFSQDLFSEESESENNGFNNEEFELLWSISFRCNMVKPLKKLVASNNNITSIPEKIVELTSLEVLDLRNNINLRTLPDCLGDMDNLEKIYIDETSIQVIDFDQKLIEKCKFKNS